jgi:hypothetical protein
MVLLAGGHGGSANAGDPANEGQMSASATR